MGYDLYPMTTLENKKKWIPEVIKEGWIALFGHDPKTAGGLPARTRRRLGSSNQSRWIENGENSKATQQA